MNSEAQRGDHAAALRARLFRWLRPVATGTAAACAFPLVMPGCGDPPLLDAAPRELFIWIAAMLLYRVARGAASMRRRMLEALVAGLVHFALLVYWLNIAMVRFGGMPQWQAIPALGLLVGYCALYWAAIPPTTALLTLRGRVPAPVAFAFAVILLEWIRGWMLTGFPWGLWGYSQARNLALIQLAGIAGVYGVSWVIACGGGMLEEALAAPARGVARRPAVIRVSAFVVAAHLVGFIMMVTHSPDPGEGIEVAALQGGIPQQLKNRDAAYRTKIVDRYSQLTEEAVGLGADLVVWPEASWPGRVSTRTRRLGRVNAGVPVIVGVSVYDAGPPRTMRNAAYWIDARGWIQQRYDKQHLVPFGEYVPLRWILPVEKFVPGMLDYSPGESADPLGNPPVGILICYDGIFPEIGRAEVKAGASFLANLTNDAWYGISSAPYQHRDFYVLRAVETDRWVVRAANTGLSVFIDPVGRLHGQTRLGDSTLTMRRLWERHTRTTYVLLGDWLVAIAIGLAIGAGLNGLWRSLNRRRRSL